MDSMDRETSTPSLASVQNLVSEGEYAAAREIALSLIDASIDKFNACVALIEIERQLKNLPGAIAACQTAIGLHPENESLRLHLGWLHFEAGHLSEARDCAGKVAGSENPQLRVGGLRLHIFACARDGSWEKATTSFRELDTTDAEQSQITANESLSTFEGKLIELINAKRIRAAYNLLSYLPPQIDRLSSKLLDHMKSTPPTLPRAGDRLLLDRCANKIRSILLEHQDNILSSFISGILPKPRKSRGLKVSVITPVLNGGLTLRTTIESVLQQENVEVEYIIVDGGSTDDTTKIVQEYSSRIDLFLSEKDRGLYDAVGKGFDRATGDIFCYLNADDTFEPGALARAVEAFKGNPGYEVIYFDESINNEFWKSQNKQQKDVDFIDLWHGHVLFQASVFFTRRAYYSVGGINRTMKLAGDAELWLRLSLLYRFRYCFGHVSSASIHDRQLSRDMGAYYGELLKIKQQYRELIHPLKWASLYLRHVFLLIRRFARSRQPRARRYRRLLLPFATSRLPEAPVSQILPDHNTCPIYRTPATTFIASLLTKPRSPYSVNRVVHHEKSDIIAVYPKILIPQLAPIRGDTTHDDFVSTCDVLGNRTDAHCSILKTDTLTFSLLRRMLDRCAARYTADRKQTMHDVGPLPRPQSDAPPLKLRSYLHGVEKILLIADDTSEPNAETRFCSGASEVYTIKTDEACHKLRHADSVYVRQASGTEVRLTGAAAKFDAVVIEQASLIANTPFDCLRALSHRLTSHGRVVFWVPNANSFLFDLLGLRWQRLHVRAPMHLHSSRSIKAVAEIMDYNIECMISFTPLHKILPTAPNDFCPPYRQHASDYYLGAIAKLFDWRGRGDELFVVLERRI